MLMLTMWCSRGWLVTTVGYSLICEPDAQKSDAILVDNFDHDYLLFERARQLRGVGLASRVLVPIHTDPSSNAMNDVALAIASVLTSRSRLGEVEYVPMRQREPITLNAAIDIRRYLAETGTASVVVVSPALRSRRSKLVFSTVFESRGITVYCEPTGRPDTAQRWVERWHGIQTVAEQWLKLQYYRMYVMRTFDYR